jgi:hypothetical protein
MIILEAYPPIIPMSSVIFNIIFWGLVYIIYKNRNKSKDMAGLWRIISMFFTVLLVTLGANYAKKKVKDWWSK